jgi:hypothetical protein
MPQLDQEEQAKVLELLAVVPVVLVVFTLIIKLPIQVQQHQH